MNVTEPIINAALLGTAAKEFTPVSFPPSLEETFSRIQEKADNAEAAFYQIVALTFAYQRAGMEVSSDENAVETEEAPEEEKPYFDREAGELFNLLNINRNRYLLLYAYRKAAGCNKVIPPLYLQNLINHAFDRNNPDRRQEQELLSQLAGKRGRWLLPQMGLKDWGDTETDTWETASHEERKRMLCRLRESQPEQGLALLQTELKNESATHRDELIQCLQINLSKADEAFLQEIAGTDRSINVKQTASNLLFRIPDSELVKAYCDLLRGKLHYKMLLGWSYDKLTYTPEMKKLGLEEVSSNKKEKDEEFLLRQLAERVPLSFWEELFDCSPEKAASKLAKKPPFGPYFNLCRPIENFNDNLWAYHTLKENPNENNNINLIGLLTPEQREKINFQISSNSFSIPDSWFNADGREWGIKFSARVLQQLVRSNYYYYSKEIAEQLALYLSKEIYPKLEQYTIVHSADNSATKLYESLNEYMRIKEQINTLFNDNK
ncbi:DUF5691 domain-containing protein [Bacteroides sp.]|uniref:DUF5691 domain-containing protein n=1 Tax=Bacteroides sp. TaxID=29523 RepID=UPI0026373C2E|nr:DUF5691 domain-containing protein [Bacteroides sp.]